MIRKVQHLHLAMWGTNPPWQKNMNLHLRTNVRKAQHLHPLNQLSRKAQHVHPFNQWSGKDHYLYSTMQGTNPSCRKGSALTSDTCEEPIQHACLKRLYTYIRHMRGTYPTCMFERVCTHIWSCRNQSYSHIKMALSPRLSYLVTDQAPPFQEWHSMLTSIHVGTNPIFTSEWLSTHIWHGRNQSSHHDRMAEPLHLTMEGTNHVTMSEWL